MAGGALPTTCARCRAFLVAGRPDCPFCGAVAGAPAPPPSAGPGPSGPVAEPPRRGREPGRTKHLVIGILVIALSIGGVVARHLRAERRADALAGLLGDGPSPSGADGVPPVAGARSVDGAVADVCDGSPLAGNPAYEPGPGAHAWAIVVDPGDDPRDGAETFQIRLDGDLDPPPHPAFLEVVACYRVTTVVEQGEPCELEGGATHARYAAGGRLELRAAATARVLHTLEIKPQSAFCPSGWYEGEDYVEYDPSRIEARVDDLLALGA